MSVSKVSNSILHGCDRGQPKAATVFPKRKYANVTTAVGGILSAFFRTLLSSRYSTTLPKATHGRTAGRNRSCCCTGVTAKLCIRTTLFICLNGQNRFCNVRLISRSENDSLQFILYLAALRGVMVFEADPAYTSQECSRCHQLTKPNGKKFVCGKYGHNDHRDANAAFSLAERSMPIGGVVGASVRSDSGLLVAPFLGTEVQQCTSANRIPTLALEVSTTDQW